MLAFDLRLEASGSELVAHFALYRILFAFVKRKIGEIMAMLIAGYS
jgi:hypothetical protein